jgi:hypothetical protein
VQKPNLVILKPAKTSCVKGLACCLKTVLKAGTLGVPLTTKAGLIVVCVAKVSISPKLFHSLYTACAQALSIQPLF